MRGALVVAALWMVGCGSAPAPEKKAEAPAAAPAPVKDDMAFLPDAHRTGARVVPDHLLGEKALPGGTIGDYDDHGKKYQLFVIETDSAQDAALLLLDLKGSIPDAAFVASFGGYFGNDGGKPVFAFAKLKYLAGVVGLPRDAADPVARVLAARLN